MNNLINAVFDWDLLYKKSTNVIRRWYITLLQSLREHFNKLYAQDFLLPYRKKKTLKTKSEQIMASYVYFPATTMFSWSHVRTCMVLSL